MIPKRSTTWRRLSEETFDLLVIGGGITGCGVIRDAVRRGLKVALIEANDIASGTSSRSSKLIHGGLRYLEQREFGLVFEAVNERQVLMRIAPHLVTAQGFLFPVYDTSRHGLGLLKLGLWVYEALSMFRSPKLHQNLGLRQVRQVEPLLSDEGLKGAPLYYDCATDDARLTLETMLDAVGAGALVLNHARVESLLRDEGGTICGVQVHDQLAGESTEVRARVVVNATGPWTDRVRSMSGTFNPLLRPTKGIHIVVDYERLPLAHAVVCTHPEDGRVLFAVPWGDRAYIGTTDTDFEGDPTCVAATTEDVDYLLEACRHYFPEPRLAREDVLATWAGLRPLIQDTDANTESSVSREHEVMVGVDGLLTIAGGKLTTYRVMAQEVVEKALELLVKQHACPGDLVDPCTHQEPLPGAVGWPADGDINGIAERVSSAAGPGLSAESALHLAVRYGTRGIDIGESLGEQEARMERLVEGRPEVMGIVDWAVTQELACTLEDVMVRRTQLFFRDVDQGLGAAPRIADRMADLLGWSLERRDQEVLSYEEEVQRSRQWRTD